MLVMMMDDDDRCHSLRQFTSRHQYQSLDVHHLSAFPAACLFLSRLLVTV